MRVEMAAIKRDAEHYSRQVTLIYLCNSSLHLLFILISYLKLVIWFWNDVVHVFEQEHMELEKRYRELTDLLVIFVMLLATSGPWQFAWYQTIAFISSITSKHNLKLCPVKKQQLSFSWKRKSSVFRKHRSQLGLCCICFPPHSYQIPYLIFWNVSTL